MGLHAYCAVPEDCRARGEGIAGAPVCDVAIAPLTVWCSEHAARPQATLETARAHDRVIRGALAAGVTPVPLRYGHWFADAVALAAAVRERVPAWAEALRTLEGTVEMGVRVTAAEPVSAATPVHAQSGTDYLHALRERQRTEQALEARGREVLEAIREAVRGCVEREFIGPERSGAVLSVAHLVRRARVEAYRAALVPVTERFAELRFHASGPWPPYSFVS